MKKSKIKEYALLLLIFIVFYISIDTASRGVAPPTFGYFLCATLLIATLLAYRRHSSRYIKTMYMVAIVVQLIFVLALPYGILHTASFLNSTWPLYPEILWTTGSLVFWYYVISFILTPIMVFLYGRRAWCAFTCSMGVLAETLGDNYRGIGKKGANIHAGFVALKWFIIIGTIALTVAALTGKSTDRIFFLAFLVFFILLLRTILMTAVNILLMPKFGARIWCKYFCPQGMLLGLLSRLGRFALVKDISRCVGCGTCNSVCSMSIDITGGPAINRTGNCVGCGVCVEVCPNNALSMTTNINAFKEQGQINKSV